MALMHVETIDHHTAQRTATDQAVNAEFAPQAYASVVERITRQQYAQLRSRWHTGQWSPDKSANCQ